ncbi:hypothetical protein Esti_000401 [Eimeria stiedai]
MSQPLPELLQRSRPRHLENSVPQAGEVYVEATEAGNGVENELPQAFYGAGMRHKAAPRGVRSALLFGAVFAGVVLNAMVYWCLLKVNSTGKGPLHSLAEAPEGQAVVTPVGGMNERLVVRVKAAWPWELGEIAKRDPSAAIRRKVVFEDPSDSSGESSLENREYSKKQ